MTLQSGSWVLISVWIYHAHKVKLQIFYNTQNGNLINALASKREMKETDEFSVIII